MMKYKVHEVEIEEKKKSTAYKRKILNRQKSEC